MHGSVRERFRQRRHLSFVDEDMTFGDDCSVLVNTTYLSMISARIVRSNVQEVSFMTECALPSAIVSDTTFLPSIIRQIVSWTPRIHVASNCVILIACIHYLQGCFYFVSGKCQPCWELCSIDWKVMDFFNLCVGKMQPFVCRAAEYNFRLVVSLETGTEEGCYKMQLFYNVRAVKALIP